MCQHRTKSASDEEVEETNATKLLMRDVTLNQIIQDTEAEETLIGRRHSNHRSSVI